METGLIEEWLVEPGTVVKSGEPLLRMATDKVNVDVEAEGDGVFHPVVAAGADLPPGTLIAWLLEDGEAVPGEGGSDSGEPAAAVIEPSTDGSAPAPAGPPAAPAGQASSGTRLIASPSARRVAAERGIDVTTLRGTGPGDRIVMADVFEADARVAQSDARPRVASPLVRRDAAAAGVDLAAVAASGPGGRLRRADVSAATRQSVGAPGAPLEVIPLKGMRAVIAARMHSSLQEMAQLTHGMEVSMDAAVALREQLKQQWESVPTITDLAVRASALALVDHPRLNATVEADRIVVHSDINVGLAVALDDGLVVPVVRNADRLTLSAISAETKRLAAACRDGRQALADLEGGTFTVSTLGGYGVDFFTPVISPGQVAILGIGRLHDSVRWEGERPVRTQVLTLSLTFDHRAVDGAPAADFLRTVAAYLASPLTLLS
jgi:pyruvate dehydrogenase E2 component (dihydrolipoamide acetyltransferase)